MEKSGQLNVLNTRIWWVKAMFLVSAALLTLNSCAAQPLDPPRVDVDPQEVIMVETFQTTATVAAIDRSERRLTLTRQDGSQFAYTAGPEVRNFNQIRVGDQVKATVVEEIAVFLEKGGTEPTIGGAREVALAPKGAKPGIVMADTVRMTARVRDVDINNRKVTLEFPDGKVKSVDVPRKIDLTKVYQGDNVVVLLTEGVAITVESP